MNDFLFILIFVFVSNFFVVESKVLCRKRQEVVSPSNSVQLAEECPIGGPGCLCDDENKCKAGLICK